MTKQTVLNKKQQEQFLSDNWQYRIIEHKWSCRGMGSSRIIDQQGLVIAKAGGCGYDRFGTALGNAIETMLPDEVLKLAASKCKGRRREYKKAPDFYGLFYNSKTGKAWLDGGCGNECMRRILNKIGFSLEFNGQTDTRANSGSAFYRIVPLTSHDRKFLK